VYQTTGAAGADLCAAIHEAITLKFFERTLIPTGLKIELPKGYEAQIRPRSGLALKNGIILPNSPGTIDCDYRGEIKIIIMNMGQDNFIIENGMRIAQMVICPAPQAHFNLVKTMSVETVRGEGGFGSTGVIA
jgi:dUTP pyrophosphatase